jgi:glutamyl-Q tRNA(Asp) synthetase
MPVTRFAPSPTGYLHLGHAYSALFAFGAAERGSLILRIEDIDPIRCKPEFTDAIVEDLTWLGLSWQLPVRQQSHHMSDYSSALDKLREGGFVYPCFCTRKEVERDALKAAHAPHASDGGFIYPGTCRALTEVQRSEKLAQYQTANWRLDLTAAQRQTGDLYWYDRARGKNLAQPELFGDVVLARKDVPTSYHLSVTVDDYLQGIGLVTRGKDLLESTHIHRLLQALLGYDAPEYHHHALLTDNAGRRYAKRDQSITLRALRAQRKSAADVLAEIRDAYLK